MARKSCCRAGPTGIQTRPRCPPSPLACSVQNVAVQLQLADQTPLHEVTEVPAPGSAHGDAGSLGAGAQLWGVGGGGGGRGGGQNPPLHTAYLPTLGFAKDFICHLFQSSQ